MSAPNDTALPPLDEEYQCEYSYAATLESGAQYSIVSLKAEVKCRERQLLEALAKLAEAELELKVKDAMLAMTVARLGGMTEGEPTNKFNFLQRIDELREIERQQE